MDQTGRGWNCVSYLWWSLAFAVSSAVLACFFIPLSASPDSLASHLDERALYVVGTMLELSSAVLLLVGCCVISKEQPERDKERHRFLRIVLGGLLIFALVTVANFVVQLMGDIQLQISSSKSPDLQSYCSNANDNFDECNCVSYTVILHHVVKLLFAVMQTIFLVLFASKRLKHRWWLQPVIATILIADLYAAVWALIFKFREEQSHYSREKSPLFPDFPGAPPPLKGTCQKIAEKAFLYKFRISVVQWLYPLQTEFFLCASGMFLGIWLNLAMVEEGTRQPSTTIDSEPPHIRGRAWTSIAINGNNVSRMCSRGTVVITVIGAVIAVVLTVSNIVRGRVPCSTAGCEENTSAVNTTENDEISLHYAMLWDGSQWIVQYNLTLVVTILILLDLVCCHKKEHGHFNLDMRVLGVFLPIVLVVKVMEIIAAGYFTPSTCVPWLHAQLTIASNVLALADALFQTALVFHGCEFSHSHMSIRDNQDPVLTERTRLIGSNEGICIARYLLLFLAICDLPVWLDRSLEALNIAIRTHSAPSQYFGPDIWLNIVSCINPVLALFYFHLSACLCELFLSFTPKRSNTDS